MQSDYQAFLLASRAALACRQIAAAAATLNDS